MMTGNPFAQSTSRVCTPTPIDPSLSESSTPTRSTKRETILNIPMTVDELQAMIFKTVQNAVGSKNVPLNVESATQEQDSSNAGAEEEQLVSPKAVQIEEVEDVDADIGVFKVEE